jgi:F0F1-type ATP synthase delta subunit
MKELKVAVINPLTKEQEKKIVKKINNVLNKERE